MASSPHPDKEKIVALVGRLLHRSGLTIKQVVARMQADGCDISRASFENRFTSRVDRYFNIPPDWTLALIAAFTQRLTDRERCTAAEAIELARLARLPIDGFKTLQDLFPPAEFKTAYSHYAPDFEITLSQEATPPAQLSKSFDLFFTCLPDADDEAAAQILITYLAEKVGLNPWPLIGHLTAEAGWPREIETTLAACHCWVICLGANSSNGGIVTGLRQPPVSLRAGLAVIVVILPGARWGPRSRLPVWLQHAPWIEFRRGLHDDLALARLVVAIQEAIPTLPTVEHLPDTRCPYRGLQVFDEAHADFFFGREADVEWLLDSLRSGRFLAVIGPSGSGKSSLVRAGLIPALRQGELQVESNSGVLPSLEPDSSDRWLIQRFEPGPRPLETLAVALMACCPQTLPRNLRQLIEDLAVDERGLHLLTMEILARQPDKTHLALVIDQFEEVFTLCDDETARRDFIDNLLYPVSVSGGRLVVILTIRADFYSQAATYPDLAGHLAERQILVSPMTELELTQVITRPAQKVGLQFEPGLVDRLLQDAAAEPGALPLLQYTLLELWQHQQGGQMTLAAYQAIGGVHGALAQRAEALLTTFTPAQQAIMRRVMLRLTRLGEGTADTRRRAEFAELVYAPAEADDVRTVITRLADARLVTTSANEESGLETVDVAHETLIRGWPTLQRWLTEDREALRLHQQLAEAAAEWARHQRDFSYLYRGARLAALEEWAALHAAEMNALERDFLQAGLSARQQDTRAFEQRRRWTLLALTTGLVIMVALALLAFSQWRQVEAERQMTLSRQLAAQARNLLGEQPDAALLLSVEAYRTAETLEARSTLLESLQTYPYLTTFSREHTGWVWAVAFSPDGQTLASGSADGTIILWDTTTRQPLGPPLPGHTDWVRTVAFSPDGKILASGSADSTIILWDTATGQPLGSPLVGHTSFITGVAFGPNGNMLASSSADGTVRLWDAATGQPLGAPLTGHASFVLTVSFSPDGQLLASGGEDQAVILWDISARRPGGEIADGQSLAHALTDHQGAVSAVSFSPDGKILASGSADGTIILWDASTFQPVGPPLAGHQGPVSSLAFSLDGQTLVSGSNDKTVIIWDLAGGTPLVEPLKGHTGEVLGVAVHPDSAGAGPLTLASGSADGTVAWWYVSSYSPLARPLSGHTGNVESVAFSPDGQSLASAGKDTTIILWDITAAEPISRTLTGHTDAVRSLAFSAGGEILTSGSRDRNLIRWNVEKGQPEVPPIVGHPGPVNSVAVSSDDRTVASGSEDEIIRLWDVAGRSWGSPLIGHSAWVRTVAFSPDGQLLASGADDSTVRLWAMHDDSISGQPIGMPLDHPANVFGVAFSPDGQTLASGGDAGVILWDVAAQQPIRQPIAGHAGRVYAVSFSPTGQTLASGGDDHVIMLWDVGTHRLVGLPFISSNEVWSVAYSPDGTQLASGDTAGTVMLWDINPESWQQRACRIANRNLSRAEWEQYLDHEPYRLTCGDAPVPTPAVPTFSISDLESAPVILDRFDPDEARSAVIVEEFDSEQGFIQTSSNVYIAGGKAFWHIERSGAKQYLYRPIPPFSGNVRLTVRGRLNSWTNNCDGRVGIGDEPGNGIIISFGWTGGGCSTNGPWIDAPRGVKLDRYEQNCRFVGDWLWVDSSTPYTASLTIIDDEAQLDVEGIGSSTGTVRYEGPYTTLWVGNKGNGDWPACTGTVDAVIVEPLD